MTVAHAVWFAGPRRAEVRDEPVARPAPGEIVLEAIVSLVSQGSEMRFYRGNSGATQLPIPATMSGTLPFPIKFGYQVVARVIEAVDCAGFEVGDRVFAAHPHQSRFTMPAGPASLNAAFPLLTRLPDTISDRRAAFLNMYSVALNCLLDVPVRVGECVVVSGLGLIGTFCAHIARRLGEHLVLVEPVALRREIAGWIGADVVVAPERARQVIAEVTDGRGADVFIDASGAPGALQLAIDSTGLQGTVAMPSSYGLEPLTINLSDFHRKRLRLAGSFGGAMGAGPLWSRRRALAIAADQLASIDVDVLITHTLPLHAAPDAYALVDTRPSETLAVLLAYQD